MLQEFRALPTVAPFTSCPLLYGTHPDVGLGIVVGCSYLARLVAHVLHDLADTVLCLLWIIGSAVVEVNDLLPLGSNVLWGKFDVYGEANTAGSLPPGSAAPTAADLVQTAGGGWALVTTESKDKGRYVVRLEGLDHFLGKDRPRHGSAGVGGNGVGVDVVLVTLESEGTGETEDAAFLEAC